jgi:hypothetical protein
MTKTHKPVRAGNRNRQSAIGARKAAKAAQSERASVPPMPSAQPSKKASIIGLLERPQGAAIDELTKVTGWQPHSVRAALTGLRKEGREFVRCKDGAGTTCYSLSAQA